MIISGDNACLACLLHNPSKVKEVLINKEKKGTATKLNILLLFCTAQDWMQKDLASSDIQGE